jgi:hypothetical protein
MPFSKKIKKTFAVFFLIPIRNWAAECFDQLGMPFSKTIKKKQVQFFSNTYSELGSKMV